jgi:hypothetical protein
MFNIIIIIKHISVTGYIPLFRQYSDNMVMGIRVEVGAKVRAGAWGRCCHKELDLVRGRV